MGLLLKNKKTGILNPVITVYAYKLKSARLVKGMRLVCVLHCLAFLIVLCSALTLAAAGAFCAVYGAKNALDGVFALLGIPMPSVPNAVYVFLLLSLAAFLFVCAASLSFALKARFFYAADKNQARPRSFVSFAAGRRYLRYKRKALRKKAALFCRFTLPFFAECLLVGVWLYRYGAQRLTVVLCACLLGVSLAAALVCVFVRCRCCDEAVYLMFLNPKLPPEDAISSSEEKTEGKLIALAGCKLSLLPKKLACLLIFPLPVLLPRAGVFFALVCERLYGEDKRRVKLPAVTFYINKKTKMEEASP